MPLNILVLQCISISQSLNIYVLQCLSIYQYCSVSENLNISVFLNVSAFCITLCRPASMSQYKTAAYEMQIKLSVLLCLKRKLYSSTPNLAIDASSYYIVAKRSENVTYMSSYFAETFQISYMHCAKIMIVLH